MARPIFQCVAALRLPAARDREIREWFARFQPHYHVRYSDWSPLMHVMAWVSPVERGHIQSHLLMWTFLCSLRASVSPLVSCTEMGSRSPHRHPLRSKSHSTIPNTPESKPILYKPRCKSVALYVAIISPISSYLGTTDEYTKAIAHHSQQHSPETLYPGEIYDTLRRFLEQPNTAPNASGDFAWLISPNQQSRHPSPDSFSVSDSSKSRSRSQGFSDPNSCIEALRSSIELSNPQVLFLRGHPSPSWLASIGAFCYVDPELFRWFLRYREAPGSDCYFDCPPSSMSNIFRFKFSTIGSQSHRYDSPQEVVDALRQKAAKEFEKYQQSLRLPFTPQPGHSIVRNFHVLDERHCVIEQEIVISILEIGKTWMGMIPSRNIICSCADDNSCRLYRCRIRSYQRPIIRMAQN